MRRPFGVTLIALLFGLSGAILMSFGLVAFRGGRVDLNHVQMVALIAAAIIAVVSVILIVLGIGLWRLRESAREWTQILQVFSIIGILIALYRGQIPSLGALILNIIIFVYLRQPTIRAAFAG